MLSISAFKDFENIGSFQINDEKSKSLTLKIKQVNWLVFICINKRICLKLQLILLDDLFYRGTGPPGIDGVADKIVVRNTYTGEAGSSARVIDNKVKDTHILDFVIPKGEDGQNIPLKSAYIVTFNENTSPQGIEVLSNSNIPLKKSRIRCL
ncbi:MAG: hypothetical protein L6V91_07215 [Bacilli bacterium]|nr:MAG: hypothetical protein L6V91_07215 [Bacilli bacterium]